MLGANLSAMRIYILIFCVTLFFCSNSNSQIIYDSIPFHSVILNNQIAFGSSRTILITKYGQPDSVQNRIDECDDNEPYSFEYYGQDVFKTKHNKIEEFTLRTGRFHIQYHNITVGDSISKLKELFPNAFDRKVKISKEVYKLSVFIGIGDQKLIFTVKGSKIIEIASYFPC